MEPRIRKANISDVNGIKKIIDKYADEGKILPRSAADIRRKIGLFFVAIAGGKVVGCCSLRPYSSALAEIRSLGVLEEFSRKGIGTSLVKSCLDEAKKRRMKEVFTFTCFPEFFEKINFKKVDRKKIYPKLLADCIKCKKYNNCDETALKITMK